MRYWVLVLFLTSNVCLAAEPPCNDFFEEVATETEAQDSTSELIAYLTRLLDENKIGEKELQRLTKGEAPITEEESRARVELRVFRQDIDAFLHRKNTDRDKVKNWSKQFLDQLNRERQNREAVATVTEVPFHPIRFHRVLGAQSVLDFEPFQISYDMEVMETLVTQKHWFDVMGSSPNFSPDGAGAFLNPDQPAMRISWWSILEFANRLSLRDNLDPVYNLDGIEFTGSAEYGNLLPSSKSSTTYRRLVRDRNGYRLPTVKEWNYIATRFHELTTIRDYIRERLIDMNSFDVNLLGLKVFSDVASTPPLIINGNTFYDFVVLISEWTDQPYEEDMSFFVSKGHLIYRPDSLVTENVIEPVSTERAVGFRLLRTLR